MTHRAARGVTVQSTGGESSRGPRGEKVPWKLAAVVLSLFSVTILIGKMPWAVPLRAAHSIPLGDYAGPDNPAGIARLASSTGAHITLATDFLDGSNGWAGMTSTAGLAGWRSSGYKLVLAVPMFPTGGQNTLAQGAQGRYNGYFVTLARNLVNAGEGSAYVRPGWEFNGTSYPWQVDNATDAANYASFFREIVKAMRSVGGESFKFIWDANGDGPTNYSPRQAYPGGKYVNFIGSDVYGNCWCTPFTPQNGWAQQLAQPWGLNWLASFARHVRKPIVFPEWGVDFRSDGHGLGDDSYFVNEFAQWIGSHHVVFASLFTFHGTGDSDIIDGRFPNALKAFEADFG